MTECPSMADADFVEVRELTVWADNVSCRHLRYAMDITAVAMDKESVAAILREPQPTAAVLVHELFSRCRTEVIESQPEY